MKRFLTAGEGCARTKSTNPSTEKNIFKHLSASFIALSLFYTFTLGIAKETGTVTVDNVRTVRDTVPHEAIKPIEIGDTIPEAVWNLPLQVYNHPEGLDSLTLGSFRDKMIILDFWATYCKPCISSIEHFQEMLRDPLLSEAVLVPVLVYDLASKVPDFFQRSGMDFMTIVNNDQLNLQAFANYLTGFGVVWIANNRLVGVPYPSDYKKEHVRNAISGNIPDIPFRKGYPLLDPINDLR